MRKSKFSQEQIAAIVKESEAGVRTSELCRRHGMVRASLYEWKYGSRKASGANRLKQLEDENQQLKHIVAERTAEIRTLKAALTKRM